MFMHVEVIEFGHPFQFAQSHHLILTSRIQVAQNLSILTSPVKTQA